MPDFAREQARGAGHDLADELHLLTVHGVLHLLGYDHGEPEQEREMFGLQDQLLTEWRIECRRAATRDAQRVQAPASGHVERARRARRWLVQRTSMEASVVVVAILHLVVVATGGSRGDRHP